MFTIDGIKRSVWLLAFVVTALAACGGSSARTGGPATPAGVYVMEDTTDEFLVLEEGGRFCFVEQGLITLGAYEVEGTSLTLTPEADDLGPQTGTIDGDVITDPDGVEWVRSTEIDPASCEGTEVSPPPSPLDGLAEQIATAAWPSEADDAAAALRRLPRAIDGSRANPPHPVGVGSGTATVAYPDPTYQGPVSGVIVLVVRVPRSMLPAQLVDATAHLGFGLTDERKRLDPDEAVPLVVAQIIEVQGAGKLPAGHSGYLAVWSTRDGHVAFGVVADSLRTLADGIGAIRAAANGG